MSPTKSLVISWTILALPDTPVDKSRSAVTEATPPRWMGAVRVLSFVGRFSATEEPFSLGKDQSA
jgi:hypothetical protein